MLLEPVSRILFIGDSITDCGRGRGRLSWDSDQDPGDGFVGMVHAALSNLYPDHEIRILNAGVSGDTVRDLAARWASDVLPLHPSWLSILIGINDVWGHFSPFGGGLPVSLDEFHRTLDSLIQQARPDLDGLLMLTPYYLEPDRSDPMRGRMDRFGHAVRELAIQHKTLFVDTQAAFDEIMADLDPNKLAADKVHVGNAGHMIIARAVLNALGADPAALQPGQQDT